jgi:hypothetical protein
MAADVANPPPPEPPPSFPEPPRPSDDDAPGALMDVLSRADAEAAEAEAKRKAT